MNAIMISIFNETYDSNKIIIKAIKKIKIKNNKSNNINNKCNNKNSNGWG